MAPVSLKIVLDNGAVTRKVKFETTTMVDEAHDIVKDKMHLPSDGKDYGLFLRSADDDLSGVWLENHRTLDYYMLRDGDSLDYLCRMRNLRVKMLDGTVKTLQVDEAKPVGSLMFTICSKIGISNHDEYGLCQDEDEEVEESKDGKHQPGTGTLTLTRKAPQKEKDVVLEQLIKKHKTDDDVQWLDQYRTLREMGVDPKATLLLKRRLYYSDRNVDARDPVQLNLLYVQIRDVILNGRHPVTEEQAATFAGIQCQIHFGDFQEEKHKPGFIENLKEYLPDQYSGSWSIEKKILKEYRKHQGLSQLDAKFLYTKTARDLPTYGVTFFLVKEKEKKGKKKLVPRLLGINAESILRLDEVTKEILQVWPLTHVKTYHVGKGETFTLNFGDYSDKEYCVKTRDAFAIRDILQGYIDLIRKRMLRQYADPGDDGMIITQETVHANRGQVIEHVAHGAGKIVEHSFVGPTKLIPYEQGAEPMRGTQIMTVQQIVVADQANNQQRAIKGEVPMRSDMSKDFVRKLNRLNSNSVKIVTLLTDPDDLQTKNAQKIVNTIEQDMPIIVKGVQETVEKQSSEADRKKLLDKLQELMDAVKKLSSNTRPGYVNPSEAQDAAKKIADISTQMYFSIDPKTQRRSELLRMSRQSFIIEDQTDARLRRPSFIAAATTALHAVDTALQDLGDKQEYTGPPVDADTLEQLEKGEVDKIGKLSAAVALYLTAHADPKNIDYGAAVNSMNTINEIMPELVKDTQAIGSTMDEQARKAFYDDILALCDATKKVCTLTGTEDHEKMQEASNDYADFSGKLIFTLGRGANADKENEIIELSKQVGDKTSVLLVRANELTAAAPRDLGAAADDVDTAGVRAAIAARDLLACAQLTAPAIHEPHCQSALTAAAETLSSSVQQLAASWKPLVEDPSRQALGEQLQVHTLDVAKALDRLKNSYGNLSGDDQTTSKEKKRIRFAMSLCDANDDLMVAEEELNKPYTSASVKGGQAEDVEKRLSDRMAQLNAAIAALLAATADRENPDYVTAELAINTIKELTPEVIKETKAVSAGKDEATRAAMLQQVRALCEASRGICTSVGQPQAAELGEAVAKFAGASGKLVYVVNPRAKLAKEQEIMALSSAACGEASKLLAGVQQLASGVGGEGGAELDARGAHTADAAQALLTAAQVTSPSMDSPRCQSALVSAADKLSQSAQQLRAAWQPLQLPAALQPNRQQLERDLQALEAGIDQLRAACSSDGGKGEKDRLKLVSTLSKAKHNLQDAEKELNKPITPVRGKVANPEELEHKLSDKMAQLNAAIAALIAATSDKEKPDYAQAEQAVKTISELMPEVVKETKAVSAGKDEATRAAMLQQVRALCEASRGICTSVGQPQAAELGEAVAKFADASGKLVYVVNPRAKPAKEQEIMALSSAACGEASKLLAGVQQLASGVGGEGGAELDARGAHTADAAQALLTAAQVTSPSMDSPRCQSALVSAADKLSQSAQQLRAAWQPLQLPAALQPNRQQLERDLQALEAGIDQLRAACSSDGGKGEKDRLKLVSTLSKAKHNLQDAEKELNKPITPVRGKVANPEELEHKLSDKMAQLNAAIAALIAATSDKEKPDYAQAEQAVKTFSELMPEVVKETKAVSAGKDEATRAAMLQQVRALCEASRGICTSVGQPQAAELGEAVAKFAGASGKLVYVVNPRAKPAKEQEIMALSSAACGEASKLLAGVQQLASGVGGEGGAELDARGAHTADAAQALLTAAQVTSPSMDSPRCQSALVSAADKLSQSAQQLRAAWQPLQLPAALQPNRQQLERDLQALEAGIDQLRAACSSDGGKGEKDRLKLVSTLSKAKHNLQDAEKELNKPITPVRGKVANPEELEHKLSDKMAQLNAAIAALIAATSDKEKPDYAQAEQAVKTFSELMPEVVKETKAVSAGKDEATRAAMLQQVRALCEASRGICTSVGQPQAAELGEAVAKFAGASGKLVYVVNPRAKPAKEQEIMALSSAACGEASKLLAGVQQLASGVGGEGGAELDARGAHTADAAQALLTAAQVTSPSMDSPRCQSALVSAADKLSQSAQQLRAAWQPLQLPAALQPNRQQLERYLQALEAGIDQLRAACSSDGGKGEKDRLKLVSTLSKAKHNLQDAEKELNKPITPVRGKVANPEELEHKLSDKMAQLNAAIAALIAATSDKEKPDYAQAEQAVKTISELMPEVVKETKAVSAGKDEATRAAMLQQVRALCEASRGICTSVGQPQAAELGEAVAKFAGASGKLVYVVNPRAKPAKEQEIMALSSAACGEASKLLAGVQQLASGVGGEGGAELDARGAHTADAAQALLTAAQVTSPSMDSPRCQSALVSAADKLSQSAQQLRAAWQPLQLPAGLQPNRQQLERDLQALEAGIDQLRAACSSDGGKGEKDRLKLVSTLSKANDNLEVAEKELNKPITPVRGKVANPEELEHKLSDKMAQLNAAIAALIAATSDKEKTDYAQAEQAVKTISELMPEVVKETKAVSAGKDEATRAAMLQQVRALSEASRGICTSVGQPQAAELGEAVAKFAGASGKLVYVVNPRAKLAKEQEIMALSSAACGEASKLLAGVQQLASGVGGEGGAELDARGAHTADAAQALLTAAQVTSPSMDSPRCQSALVSAADKLSQSAQQLRAAWQPLQLPAGLQPNRQQLERDLQALEAGIDQLRAACSSDGGKGEKDRLKLVSTLSKAKHNLQDAEKELNKPITPVRGKVANPEELEHKLSDKMAQLNAAIAALIAATSDKEKTDYAQADQAVKTISELMPEVVKETKAVSAGKDEATRAAMLQQVRALCEASRGICTSVGQPQAAELGEAVAKFADASGKLVYIVNPRAKLAKEQEIMALSSAACGEASKLLAGVQQLASGVGGEGGAELDARGAHTADAAQALLTAAQVTSPSMDSPRCQSALVSAADKLSQSAQQLRAAWQPLQLPAGLQPNRQQLERDLQALEAGIDQLRAACSSDGGKGEKDRLKLVSTLSKAKHNLQDAEKELNKPITPVRGKVANPEELEHKLSDKMAQLNAAIAALIAATSDKEKPDYAQAEQAVKTISELMPEVVKETKAVSAGKDEATRAAMLQQVRALCEASRGICTSVGQPQAAELGEAVAKFADASGKLNDVVSLRANRDKEQRIMNVSASVCGAASKLLAGVQHLAGGVGDQAGHQLDVRGTNTADAAQALLTCAQVTAPSMDSPRCQSALVSAADKLSQSAQQLRAAWQPLQLPAALQPHRQQLEGDLQALENELDQLRAECLSHDKKPPATATKPRPPVPVKKDPGEPASPRRVAHAPGGKRSSAFAQEFLDQMRMDEAMSQDAAKDACTRKTDDEKILHQQFVQSVDDADKDIRHAEDVLRQVYNSQVSMTKGAAISPGEVTVKQRELEDKLAAAGVEVANLVSANYADNIDYKTATKSTKVLPQLMNSIVEDAKILQHNLINAEARKAFMNDMLGLCQASRKLCDSAKNNREKLNDAAVEFGDKSAKLLHEVSTDVDPFVENEIISRAKAIGDSASRLALESAELASSAAATGPGGDGCARNICEAGASCVDAAGKLVYTSKLVSPSIHNSTCQEALISSAENLSTKLKAFTESWKPLASDPHNKRVKELATGASELEALLEQLRKDVRGDLGKHRIEKLVVEDTPLRQFTMKILEDAKSRAERTDIPADQRREYANYANKLADAVRALDLTNSRCLRSPHDTNKRRELECAIQNLQAIVLQERPRRSDKDPGKIVDLLDFVKDVSNEAEKLTEVASSADLPRGKQTVADIKDQCHKINLKAFRLLEPEPSPAKADHTMLDDILEVDQFGQECDNRVEQISSLINNLEGEKAGPVLKEQAIPLTETCNLLRFAAKSAVSTTQSASLEETLNDLDDLENSVIKVLIPECGARNTDPMKSPLLPPSAPPPWAAGRVAGAVWAAARAQPAQLAPALTAYIADAAARTDLSEPTHRDQLLHHLHKLVDLIKSLTVCTSKRVATWQPVDGPQIASITEQILRELDNPESIFGGGSKRPPMQRLVSASDVSRVLSPSDTYKFDGDHKQLEHKVQQLSTQLSSMCSTVMVSVEAPASLARSLHAAADVAGQLAAAAAARATAQRDNDPIKSKRIEEAAQEMSYSTYNLLKTAEFVSHDPHNQDSRRKLLDACRGLTDSINKLVRVTSPGNKVQRSCGELTRSLQLQQGLLQARQPPSALHYADCVLGLQSHHDVIQKLKSEEAMPRDQFLQSLDYVTSAVCNSTQYAAQCAYLISISDSDKDTAKEGLVDVPQIQKAIGSVQDSCMKIIRSGHPDQAKEEKPKLQKRVQELVRGLEEAHAKAKDGDVKLKLTRSKDSVNRSANALYQALDQNRTKEKVSPLAMDMLDVVNRARALTEHPALLPAAAPNDLPPETKDKCEQLINNSKTLLTKTQALITEVSNNTPEDDDEMMTWVMYNTNRNSVLDVFDSLLKSIKINGHRAGILEIDPSELEEGQTKSFVETQVEIANKWLKRASCKADVKTAGEEATKNVIEIANKMCEDLNGSEKEEMSLLISETEQLLSECSKKYDNEKYSVLMDRLRELRKMVERGVVTRVVEDFMEGEEPLADLDILADAERDEAKRKFLLERKIAELLAQLGRVTTTARFVARTGRAGELLNQDLHKCSEQTELLAPMLVKAAQERINSPNDKAVVDNYKALLAKYAESLSKVRELCDQAVDPMDFVQTAGETMQRMREESTQHNDPQKCAYTSTAITKLANRVIQVSMSSSSARSDPELQRALAEAQRKLSAATPAPNVRASRLPDWRDTTAEILRTTGEVESVLGGENIFNKQADADQPIYNAALSLHAAVRGWSSRDNDIVAAARKCAVQMARLADYMHTDRKHELLVSSKSIVAESHEVALLARRLAHECTDHRIKTNLLQSCERIPTISGQLKMLTTVKGSSLGHQGSEEDKEAMDMLVGNAENLMLSIQEVVKAAASASVKIASQRGPRMRWVRKNYY